MKKPSTVSQGILFALVNAVSLGTLGIIDKVGSTHFVSPLIFSTQSVLISLGFVFLFSLLFTKGKIIREIKAVSPSALKLIIVVGTFASGFFVFLRFLGLTQSTGTFATLSQIIITALTAILATIFLQEKLSRTFWILFIIIIVAMYFVSIGKFTLSTILPGDLYIILGAGFVAVSNIFSKKALKYVSPLLLSIGRFFFGGLFLVLVSLLFHFNTVSVLSIWSLLSGLFWAINVICFNSAVQKLGVTFATSILMMAPVITMILEYTILKHPFNLIQIVAAFVVIIAGILMMVTKKK